MPPAGARVLHVWVLDGAAQLRSLRASLFEAVTGHLPGSDDRLTETVEKMLVVATELATNALQHGLAPTSVQLATVGGRYILDVADHDTASSPRWQGPPSSDSMSGRGLMLARAFSLAVGWYVTQQTKHVWATFDKIVD